jgi:hypothetical protein
VALHEEGVQQQTAAWTVAIKSLAKVCKCYPQLAYADLHQKSLQHEWEFLQRVTDRIGTEFVVVESSLKDNFLPALLGLNKVEQPLRDLLAFPVKDAGLALPNPTSSTRGNFTASTIVCGNLVVLLKERAMFNGAEHTSVIKEGHSAIRMSKVAMHDGELLCFLWILPQEKRRTVEQEGCQTGAWISICYH